MKSLTKFILFILSISYALTEAGDLDAACVTTGTACKDANAECKSDLCKCKSGYYKKDAACAANIALEAECAATDTCVDNAECKESKCKCKSGYTAKDGKCEANEEKTSGNSFLKVSIISLLSLLF